MPDPRLGGWTGRASYVLLFGVDGLLAGLDATSNRAAGREGSPTNGRQANTASLPVAILYQ